MGVALRASFIEYNILITKENFACDRVDSVFIVIKFDYRPVKE